MTHSMPKNYRFVLLRALVGTLYIDRKYSRLECKAKAVVPWISDERSGAVPLKLIEQIVIMGNVSLDTVFIQQVVDEDVVLTLIGGRFHQSSAIVTGLNGADVPRRVRQYRVVCDDRICLQVARRLVSAKIRGHLRLARRIAVQRVDQRKIFFDLQAELRKSLMNARSSGSLDELRGIEGYAARIWFQSFKTVVPPELGFTGRQRRPPPDPVNAMLSLAYTLLHGKAVQVIRRHGLDADLGFYHQPLRSRQSLACDLVEPLRPRVDEWIWDGLRRRDWRLDDFSVEAGGAKMRKKARARFFPAFEHAWVNWHKPMNAIAAAMVRQLSTERISDATCLP